MYVKVLEDGNANLYTISKLKADNPYVCFPERISNSILQEYSVYPCIDDSEPSYDSLTQSIYASVEQVNGEWHYTKNIRNKSVELASRNIREYRDALLRETDWLGASDVTMSTEWVTYRQALRDIPQQDGFPFSITYPTKPVET